MKRLIITLTIFLTLGLYHINAQEYIATKYKMAPLFTGGEFNLFMSGSTSAAEAGIALFFNGQERFKVGEYGVTSWSPMRVDGNLTVNGNSNITGNADFKELRLGSHILTRESNAGKIVYQGWSDALDIVGAGTTGANRKLKFWSEGGATFTGDVYVGTTPPASVRAKLVVNDDNPAAINGIVGSFSRQGTGDVGISFSQFGVNSYGIVHLSGTGSATTGGIGFFNNRFNSYAGRLDMMIDGDGTVLIGSNKAKFQGARAVASRDSFSLWIEKGVIAADYAIENPASWSDYVFASDYKLRSLKEVSDFIQANKHLPEVPSENEIKKTGYTLHNMNTLLLKKIEELTLYMIEQEKKIEGLEQDKKENDGLRAEISEINKKLLSLKIN
ncbi:hypothetical protein [Pedobacter glucosidilyticus]|uniref:hypothetical protein n=1 Tax=Pedobacter glucosidilyticus TaxID=1122941 RepID=UPI0026EFFCE4|nr:hypothetical protein [Pedobacter glucosidilyticus]